MFNCKVWWYVEWQHKLHQNFQVNCLFPMAIMVKRRKKLLWAYWKSSLFLDSIWSYLLW